MKKQMKKISIMIPCYNEEENVREICATVIEIMEKELSNYDYEIVFIDNCSQDKTRLYLRQMCSQNPKVKAILNAKNFGQFNSPVYGMCQTTGDCTISLCCDFQDPVELIPVFVKEWENGYKIVSGIKTGSKENKIMRFLRTCYYKIIKKMSDVEQIEHFTGFGLYDKSFIQVLRDLNDPTPFIRGIVAELGYKRKDIPYTQPKRKAGKTHNNWATLYDAAMLSFTSYTKIGLRIATIIGAILATLSIVVALVYLVMKIMYWDRFIAGTVPILLVVSILGSAQLFFIGLLGEYILSMNKRIMNRPLVIEEERLNFTKKDKDEE